MPAADDRDVTSLSHESLGYATSMPALEIVIVSSTGALELLRTCLRTLREHPYSGGETLVHVVDNASTDGTPEMVRDEFPEVRLHALDWNAGFCIANNVALRELRAPYVLVLNPDTEIYPGLARPHDGADGGRPGDRHVELPARAARRHPRPRLPSAPSRPRSARSPTSPGSATRLGRARSASTGRPSSASTSSARSTPSTAPSCSIRKAAMDEVGLLDEGYWLYMEDLDWCYRFKQAGWRVVYDGRVSSLHVKGGHDEDASSHRGLRHNIAFHRSMGRFYRKFYAGRATRSPTSASTWRSSPNWRSRSTRSRDRPPQLRLAPPAERPAVLLLVVLAVLAGADRPPPLLVVAVPVRRCARGPRRSGPGPPSRARRGASRRRASSGGRGRGGR